MMKQVNLHTIRNQAKEEHKCNQESKFRSVKEWQIKDNGNRLSFHRQLSSEQLLAKFPVSR